MKLAQMVVFALLNVVLISNLASISKVFAKPVSRSNFDVANSVVQIAQEETSDSIHLDSHSRLQTGENLIVPVPADWKVGFQASQVNHQIIEFVPEGQTIQNWQDLLTIQIFFGRTSITPLSFFEEMNAVIQQLCPESEASIAMNGEENGYPFLLWVNMCRNNPQVNQAEVTLFKAIQGNDSLYLVHRAWRTPPVAPNEPIQIRTDEIEAWAYFMSLVQVCDTRIPEQSCPTEND